MREDNKNRSDGNRGAYDVGMTGRWMEGAPPKRRSKTSQSVGVYKERTPQVGESHVHWVPCTVAQGAAKEANHTEWGIRQHCNKTWHEPHRHV